MSHPRSADELRRSWDADPRWRGIRRDYSAADVARLRGALHVEHTLARRGATRLWEALHQRAPVRALGALTGNQAVQMVAAGLEAIYLSGWQVAADANTAGQMYPDQSLYPVDSVPNVVRRVNRALQRADQVAHMNGSPNGSLDGAVSGATPGSVAGSAAGSGNGTGNGAPAAAGSATGGGGALDWFAPIVADAEAGFGGDLNAFELMKAMIEAGAAGVHYEDQLASAKKCGHMGGKVLVPVREFVQKLQAARFAADTLDVPTLLIARTDAHSATLLTNDVDERDRPYLDGTRTAEGFFGYRGGLDAAIARGIAYAPYADLVWCETSTPDLAEAKRFAAGVHAQHPGKLLAYNCSPSFNWSAQLDAAAIARFQRELGAMGYAFQFVTLAGFHALNLSMFELATGYHEQHMAAYATLQDREFALQKTRGYAAVRHQAFVGTGYFDQVQLAISSGQASTSALRNSTEEHQF